MVHALLESRLCKLVKLHSCILLHESCLLIFSSSFLREEEGEMREADLRREMEERERQHRDAIERLQIQVRGDFSVLRGFISLNLTLLCSHSFILYHRLHS